MSAALRAAARRLAVASTRAATPKAAVAIAPPPPRRGLATLLTPRRGSGVLSSAPAWPVSSSRRATAAYASAASSNTGLADALADEIKYEGENYIAPEVSGRERRESREHSPPGGGLRSRFPATSLQQRLTRFSLPFPLQGISTPPSGWDLDEAPGDTLVSLTRAGLAPGEVVTVELVVDEQDDGDDDGAALFEGGDDEDEDEEEGGKKADDEDDDELAFDDSIVFTAAVARGDSALVFECRSDGSYLQVLSVSLEPNPDAAVAEEDGEDLFDDDSTAYLGPLYDELDERLQAEFEAYLAARGVDAEFGGWLAEFAGDKEQREYVAWLGKVKEFVSQK